MNHSPARARKRHLVAVIMLAIIAAALAPATASAGTYTIYTCDANPPETLPASNVDSLVSAFPAGKPFTFASRGMLSTSAGRRCSPGPRGSTRGLISMNRYQRGGTVARGAKARYVVKAPGGTRISRLRWAGATQRTDCRWTVQVYTRGPDKYGNASIRNKKGRGKDCARGSRTRARASGFTRQRTIARAAGATKFVQVVKCTASTGKKRCSNRAPNFALTKAMSVTVADSTKPSLGVYADNPFTNGTWVPRSSQSVNYNSYDNVGVKRVTAYGNGNGAEAAGSAGRACNYRGLGGLTPCPNGRGSVPIDTDKLNEGTQRISLVGTDSADNSAPSSNGVTVRVDKTAPGAVATAVAGGEGWRSANSFAVGWTNPAENDRAPITAANYTLCPAGGGECINSQTTGTNVSSVGGLKLPTEGAWTLRMYRTDAAGNATAANSSQPVTMRLDSSAPTLGFEASSAEDPTKVAVQVNDKVSGLAGGQIEISKVGSGAWQQIPTSREGANRLVSRIDDARLPAGAYAVRAFAQDHANNQGSSDKRLDGQQMILQVPLRIRTAMRAGVAKKKTVTKRVKVKRNRKARKGHKGKRRHARYRKFRRRVTVLKPSARVKFGRRVTIAGALTNSDGQGVAGQVVNVYSRTATSGERLIATLRTAANGGYRYKARASSTRILRFAYAGSPKILPTQGEVRLKVPAASSIQATPRRTVNGRRVRFRGRLGRAFGGKLVELQARLPKRWQTFRTLRTNAKGGWKSSYRFTDTSCRKGKAHLYKFRVRLPAQAGYPYEAGRSRTIKVRVRGSGC